MQENFLLLGFCLNQSSLMGFTIWSSMYTNVAFIYRPIYKMEQVGTLELTLYSEIHIEECTGALTFD